MKQEGLVTTERNTRDKRFVNTILTGKGRRVLDQTTPVAREIVNQGMSSVTESDAALMEKSLVVLRQNACHRLEDVTKRSQT